MQPINPGHWLPFYRSKNQQLFRDPLCAGELWTGIYAHPTSLVPWQITIENQVTGSNGAMQLYHLKPDGTEEQVDQGFFEQTGYTDDTITLDWSGTVGEQPCGRMLYWLVGTPIGTVYSEIFQVADVAGLARLEWSNPFYVGYLRYVNGFRQTAYLDIVWDNPTVATEDARELDMAGREVITSASAAERSTFEAFGLHPAQHMALASLNLHESVTLYEPEGVTSLNLNRALRTEIAVDGICYAKVRVSYESARLHQNGVALEDQPGRRF